MSFGAILASVRRDDAVAINGTSAHERLHTTHGEIFTGNKDVCFVQLLSIVKPT